MEAAHHVAHPRTAQVRDDALPALSELLATGRPGPVVAALAGAGLVVSQVVVRQIVWTPGVSARVLYDVLLDDPPPGLSTAQGWFGPVVAAVGRVPAGALVLGDGQAEVAIWRVPHDPALPGLAPALEPEVAGGLLADLGVPGGPVTTELRAYRPGRRAVVAVAGREQGLYLKLLRPRRVERVYRRHEMLVGSLPVTRSLGFDPDLGVLALQAMPGRTLRQALNDPDAVVPSAASIGHLLQQLPEPPPDQIAVPALARTGEILDRLTAILPEDTERFVQVGAMIRPDPDAMLTRSPVHGDLYEAQILVSEGSISGLVDMDTFGWGHPDDDVASMIGHLSAYRALAPAPDRIAQYEAELLHWAQQRSPEPATLARRIAAVVLSLAPGAFRAQSANWPTELHRRVDLAESWVRR